MIREVRIELFSPKLVGRCWKFGDYIDTDIITPADTTSFGMGDSKEQQFILENAFKPVKPNFYKLVKKGDILIAGKSFGLGSHRYQANTVLAMLGFSAIVAESVARLYFRNSIAIGFPIFQVPGITKVVTEGDKIEIDMDSWKLTNLNTGAVVNLEPYSQLAFNSIKAGGILNILRDEQKINH